MLAKVRKKQGLGEKNFYGANLSIYGGEGGSFKKSPRFDRCEFSGGRVSILTFPEVLVLGNSVKPLQPRYVGLSKFMIQVREAFMGERFSFVKRGDHEEILMHFGCFTSF
jgi:hypothetical protein